MNEFEQLVQEDESKVKKSKATQEKAKKDKAKRGPSPLKTKLMIGAIVVLTLSTLFFGLSYLGSQKLITKLKAEQNQVVVNTKKSVDEVYRKTASAEEVKDIKDSQITSLTDQLNQALKALETSKGIRSDQVKVAFTKTKELSVMNTVNKFFSQYFAFDSKDQNRVKNLQELVANDLVYSEVTTADSLMKQFEEKGALASSATIFYYATLSDQDEYFVIAPLLIQGKVVPQAYKIGIGSDNKVKSFTYIGTIDMNYKDLSREVKGADKVETPTTQAQTTQGGTTTHETTKQQPTTKEKKTQ
jgi:hypothetical protein